ncbi:hypothetical protein BH10PSE16_BH10PSE16_01110 [soil metagenome]
MGFRGQSATDSNGAAGLAPYMGLTATSLSHKVSPTYPSAHLSPDELVEVMQLTGDHSAYIAMSIKLGYAPMPLPALGDETEEGFNDRMVQSLKEYGEAMQSASVAHQKPSDRSFDAYCKEAIESILAHLSVLSSLKARSTANRERA